MCVCDRRKFRSQTSNNMDRWTSRGGKSQRRERKKRKGQRAWKGTVEKSRKTVFFQCFMAPCGTGGSKSRIAKVAGAGERSKIARCCGAKHIWKSKCSKHLIAEAVWKLRCRKSARRCGAKHIWKQKFTKHTILRSLLEVQRFKKCMELWREAHFEVKIYKTHTILGPLLEVEMSEKRTPLWHQVIVVCHHWDAHWSCKSRACRSPSGGFFLSFFHFFPLLLLLLLFPSSTQCGCPKEWKTMKNKRVGVQTLQKTRSPDILTNEYVGCRVIDVSYNISQH